jgi:tripartite motif-containing protein 2/3
LGYTSVAAAKCVNCEDFLCSNCLAAHNYMKYFEGHSTIEIVSDISREAEGAKERTGRGEDCPLHQGTRLHQFCHSCNSPVCEVCLEGEHLSHSCEPIVEVGEALIGQMKKDVEEVCKKGREIGASIETAGHTAWWLQLQHKEARKKVAEAYQQFCLILVEEKQRILSRLDEEYAKLLITLNSACKQAHDNLDKLDQLKEFHAKLTKYTTMPQCLLFKKYIEARLKSYAGFNAKRLACSLDFRFDAVEMGRAVAGSLGQVTARVEVNGKRSEEGGVEEKRGILRRSHIDAMEDLLTDSDYRLPICDGLMLKSGGALKSLVNRETFVYTAKFGGQGSEEGRFSEPSGVAVDGEGDIVVADTNNNRVQVFNKQGCYKFKLEGLVYPNRVAVVPRSGDIVVTERSPTHQIRVYRRSGQLVRKFGSEVLEHPRAVTVDKEDNIIVVECKVMRVIVFDLYGTVKSKFDCFNSLQFPNSVAVNDKREIFVCDNRQHCVIVFDYQGTRLRQIGSQGVTNYPIAVAINWRGELLIADNHNNFNLTVFTQDGHLVAAYQSKTKHSQCFDVAPTLDGSLVLTCKDFHVYIYRYAVV